MKQALTRLIPLPTAEMTPVTNIVQHAPTILPAAILPAIVTTSTAIEMKFEDSENYIMEKARKKSLELVQEL